MISIINSLGTNAWKVCTNEEDYLKSMLPCNDFVSLTEVRYVRMHLKRTIVPTSKNFETGWDVKYNNDHIRKVDSIGIDNMLKLVPYVDGDYAAAFTASDFDGTKAVRGWKCSGGDSAGNTAISSDYLPANCR